jgi:hypothetical protein
MSGTKRRRVRLGLGLSFLAVIVLGGPSLVADDEPARQEASHWPPLTHLTRQWCSDTLCLPNEWFLTLSTWSPS